MAPGWRRQFGALLAVQLFISTSHGMYAPIVSRHLAELGLTGTALTSWTGIAFAANFLAMIIMLPILGRLGDRIGRKSIMVWSGLGMATVTSVMMFAGHPAELVLLRFLQGCFTGILPFSNILVLTGAPRSRVAFSAGLMQMMGESGHVLGPVIGTAAMTVLAPRQTFPFMSALLAAGTLIVLLLVREPPRRKAPQAESANLFQDIAAIWKRKPYPHLLVAAFCTNFCMTGTTPLLAFCIERAEGRWWEGGLNLGFALAVTSLAVILSAPVLGRLADRIGPNVLLKAATALAIALGVVQAMTASYSVIVVCRFLTCLCVAGMLRTSRPRSAGTCSREWKAGPTRSRTPGSSWAASPARRPAAPSPDSSASTAGSGRRRSCWPSASGRRTRPAWPRRPLPRSGQAARRRCNHDP